MGTEQIVDISVFDECTSDDVANLKHFGCNACGLTFRREWSLASHIRRMHFNLIYRERKENRELNQVWYEKVNNSDIIVEMKQTAENCVEIKRLSESPSAIEIDEQDKMIDLTHLYPYGANKGRTVCQHCKGTYPTRTIRMHMVEEHKDIDKHHCKKCKKDFQTVTAYAAHTCKKKGLKIKVVKRDGLRSILNSPD